MLYSLPAERYYYLLPVRLKQDHATNKQRDLEKVPRKTLHKVNIYSIFNTEIWQYITLHTVTGT